MRKMNMLLKQHSSSAVIVIIAASFSFGCETRKTEVQTSYNIRSGQKYDSRKKQNDAAFLLEASNDVSYEIHLAKLAVKRAATPEVKEFAISVLTEHNMAIEEIRDMASKIDLVLPDSISADHKKQYSLVARKSGIQFDLAYCDFMSANNVTVLKKFEKIVQESNNELVKDWAWGKLGMLKREIALARDIKNGGSEAFVPTKFSIE